MIPRRPYDGGLLLFLNYALEDFVLGVVLNIEAAALVGLIGHPLYAVVHLVSVRFGFLVMWHPARLAEQSRRTENVMAGLLYAVSAKAQLETPIGDDGL